ncbi:MAG: hypothetical protein J6K90_01565 [Tidjanibacter sp.]|nr:hypothetical protein [Tidjanibacter sp.]MBR6831769.1 hypothetical protein [Tidjanibacter sp.]
MKKFLLTLIVAVFAINASAQDYNWAVGVRGGGMASGLTVKHILGGGNAWDLSVSSYYDGGLYGSMVYEWVNDLGSNFSFFYGAGGHIGAGDKDDSGSFALGVDGIVGVEYQIPVAPIAFSLDYRPALNIISNSYFAGYDFGFGVKYTF